MSSKYTKMTWDNIIDLLLTIQKNPEVEDPEYYRETDEQRHAEEMFNPRDMVNDNDLVET